jgi:hypothetical protein
VLQETLEGLQHARGGPGPVLRARTITGELVRTVRKGPVSQRRLP